MEEMRNGAVRAGILPLAVVFAAAACEESDCPTTPLEVRAFTGPEIRGTRVVCTGDGPQPLCEPDEYAGAAFTSTEVFGCDDRQGISILAPHIGLFSVTIPFDIEGTNTLVGAQAASHFACDEYECELKTRQATGGWIEPELVGAVLGGRQTGRVHVEFERWTIDAEFDTDGRADACDLEEALRNGLVSWSDCGAGTPTEAQAHARHDCFAEGLATGGNPGVGVITRWSVAVDGRLIEHAYAARWVGPAWEVTRYTRDPNPAGLPIPRPRAEEARCETFADLGDCADPLAGLCFECTTAGTTVICGE